MDGGETTDDALLLYLLSLDFGVHFDRLVLFALVQVLETSGPDIKCLVKNTATLVGFIFTMHVAQVHIDLPTLTDVDKQVMLGSLKSPYMILGPMLTRWLIVFKHRNCTASNQ